MYKQYNKLFKPLSWYEKLFNTRVNKDKYIGTYVYHKYVIPKGWNLKEILKEFYCPKGYKEVFGSVLGYYIDNVRLELENAVLNEKISIEEIYNLFISSKLVQSSIIALIKNKKDRDEYYLQKYKKNLEIGVE
jgi:hypothetical protein|nr:MAG TPA: hypothetical protein [Ackermannviridae sp.]DAW82336.1 MAG TPA: hypothetical protein [Bacteriophage sp.]